MFVLNESRLYAVVTCFSATSEALPLLRRS